MPHYHYQIPSAYYNNRVPLYYANTVLLTLHNCVNIKLHTELLCMVATTFRYLTGIMPYFAIVIVTKW